MSGQLTDKIDQALGIDVDKLIQDSDLTLPNEKDVEKFTVKQMKKIIDVGYYS